MVNLARLRNSKVTRAIKQFTAIDEDITQFSSKLEVLTPFNCTMTHVNFTIGKRYIVRAQWVALLKRVFGDEHTMTVSRVLVAAYGWQSQLTDE